MVLAALWLLAACHTEPRPRPSGPLIVSPTACSDFTVTIYFERLSSHFNREADALLDEAVGRARNCTMSGTTIIGLADAPGSSEANQRLSQQRTAAVTRAMLKRGFMGFEFRSSPPDSGGITRTTQASPFRRRVDVVFHLSPRSPASPQ